MTRCKFLETRSVYFKIKFFTFSPLTLFLPLALSLSTLYHPLSCTLFHNFLSTYPHVHSRDMKPHSIFAFPLGFFPCWLLVKIDLNLYSLLVYTAHVHYPVLCIVLSLSLLPISFQQCFPVYSIFRNL